MSCVNSINGAHWCPVYYSGYPALALRVGALRLPIKIVPDNFVSRSATSNRNVTNAIFAWSKKLPLLNPSQFSQPESSANINRDFCR